MTAEDRSAVSALETRVAALERQARLFRRACSTAVFMLFTVLLIGATKVTKGQIVATEIETQGLRLKDSTGKVRASLSTWDESLPMRQSFGARPRLLLFDDAGVERLELTISAEGLPSVRLNNRHGAPGIELDVDSDGAAGLNMFSDAHRVALEAAADGRSELRVGDAILRSRVQSLPTFTFFAGPTPRVLLGGLETDLPQVKVRRSEPALVIFDEDGRPKSSVP